MDIFTDITLPLIDSYMHSCIEYAGKGIAGGFALASIIALAAYGIFQCFHLIERIAGSR